MAEADLKHGTAALHPEPEMLIRQGISQIVAHAMIPVRQEIMAGLRETNRRLGKLEGRMEKLENRMGKIEARMDRIEADVTQLKTDVAAMKSDIATIKEILLEKL